MSRSIGLVAGAAAPLQAFAASLLAKATNNTVTLATADAPAGVSLVLGGAAPKDAHTAVITASPAKGAYAGAKLTFARSVLPRGADDTLALRDAVDVYADANIDNAAEVAQAKQSVAHTAKLLVAAAKAKGSKLTVLVKQQSKFEQVNSVFAQSVTETAEAAGVAVEFVPSAVALNQLVVFPEQLGVVASADTPRADVVELALSGLYSAPRVYIRAAGGKAPAGHSPLTVALAVAEALKEIGLTAESKKVADAALAKPVTDGGKSILAAL